MFPLANTGIPTAFLLGQREASAVLIQEGEASHQVLSCLLQHCCLPSWIVAEHPKLWGLAYDTPTKSKGPMTAPDPLHLLTGLP